MYELLCDYFGADAVNIFCFLILSALIIAWRIAVFFESNPKFSLRSSFRKSVFSIGTSLGLFFGLWCAYAQQKEEQQIAQRQVFIELFTSINEVVVSMGEGAVQTVRSYLTPEEKKSRLLPVGLATNNLAWVSESQCVTSQVREAWQRVPIRRASFRQALPFPVTVGSNTYEEVFISSSGIIGFDAPKGSELTREMPYEEAADHVYLALLWGRIDFKPRLGSKMWYGVKEDGNFVASYDTVFIDGDTNAVAKVQVEFIANGDMILRYGDLPPCATNAHTVGFQNLDGGWTLSPDNICSNTAIYLKAFGDLDLTVQDSDTDGDGISDYNELYPTNAVSITDPCNIDTDGDGIMDREEIFTFGTNPGLFSSDGSGTGDLWRVSGGFSPADTPYTNAAHSGFIGILTITTLLENAGANGGAVLRIGDQYIPVLPGTTLVSRIAVPRGATNIFILARGVNCDNAVAHVTAEASSFTKIRDPSSVFSGSFTLSPSCVTASGTIIMSAYTITPDVLCFHSPTSSTCRITSADPDVYFWTTQGFVREFTPETPFIPPNTFSNDTLQVSLVSMDMSLVTLASVTNIPVHLCNPYSGGTNDYPDSPEYDNWCKLVDGEHVWAPGFNATNCPCVLAYTNAYKCLCSRDGQKPCACLHGTCDPRAMPQDGSPTNVLGHAALIIGGTNDLLEVEVPGGSLRPCPLCACGLGFSSSASVYRHTSCIHVTPGALTTNGVFSVSGLHPSTNFADSVFIYKITDCSGSQTVTSYTRKDYTVLGTSVYPTDLGHSVSNWFIGCNVTNELTLWTGVALPADSGAVSLSVTNESGTPSPQLYVYNRIAQTNELLITPGQLTFTQNLGTWRNTYCDTNGYVKAYLICSSGGVARVMHGYETYSGQPYHIICSGDQLFDTAYVSWIEDSTTCYNFSPSLGETGIVKVVVFPTNRPSIFNEYHFKIEIIRELSNGSEQHIDWLDLTSDTMYTPYCTVPTTNQHFRWTGVPSIGFGSSASQATGKDLFTGLNESINRVFPPVTQGNPVPPPFYTAVVTIRKNANPAIIFCESRKRILVPQIVALTYESDAIACVREGLISEGENGESITNIVPLSSSEWNTQQGRITAIAQLYYNAAGSNVRFVNGTNGISRPYSVVNMEYSSGVYGCTVLDFPNTNLNDNAVLCAAALRDSVVSRILNPSLPSFSIPVTANEVGFLWSLVTVHECGHFLGLVAPGNVLDGEEPGAHNKFPSGKRVMNPGGESNTIEEMIGREGNWAWLARNGNFLKFILPKE